MKRILIQLDTDPLPSSFDRVVAVDAGVDELFSYGGVTPDNLTPLVHGAMFTRGPDQLANTAIFIGGSDVDADERFRTGATLDQQQDARPAGSTGYIDGGQNLRGRGHHLLIDRQDEVAAL